MLKAGFHRAALQGYTGFKSSPYTEGALFYAEKLVDARARDAITNLPLKIAEFLKEGACKPAGG
jgi:hypothetical protein